MEDCSGGLLYLRDFASFNNFALETSLKKVNKRCFRTSVWDVSCVALSLDIYIITKVR